jgi:hypothetical protein
MLLTQDGDNMNEDKPFESSETGFRSIELFAPLAVIKPREQARDFCGERYPSG